MSLFIWNEKGSGFPYRECRGRVDSLIHAANRQAGDDNTENKRLSYTITVSSFRSGQPVVDFSFVSRFLGFLLIQMSHRLVDILPN